MKYSPLLNICLYNRQIIFGIIVGGSSAEGWYCCYGALGWSSWNTWVCLSKVMPPFGTMLLRWFGL